MDVIRKALLWQIIQAFIVLLCIKTQLIQIEDQRRRTIRRVVTLVTIRHSIHRPRIRRPGGGDRQRRRLFWVNPGRTAQWWENFERNAVRPEEWRARKTSVF